MMMKTHSSPRTCGNSVHHVDDDYDNDGDGHDDNHDDDNDNDDNNDDDDDDNNIDDGDDEDSQLSMDMWQFCSSCGYRANFIEQERSRVNLRRNGHSVKAWP